MSFAPPAIPGRPVPGQVCLGRIPSWLLASCAVGAGRSFELAPLGYHPAPFDHDFDLEAQIPLLISGAEEALRFGADRRPPGAWAAQLQAHQAERVAAEPVQLNIYMWPDFLSWLPWFRPVAVVIDVAADLKDKFVAFLKEHPWLATVVACALLLIGAAVLSASFPKNLLSTATRIVKGHFGLAL
eukprot:tig00021374_g21129.t1